jgi:hypothetical protein
MLRKVSRAALGKMVPWTNISHGALASPQTDLATSVSCELIDHSSNLFNNNNNNLSLKTTSRNYKKQPYCPLDTYFVK